MLLLDLLVLELLLLWRLDALLLLLFLLLLLLLLAGRECIRFGRRAARGAAIEAEMRVIDLVLLYCQPPSFLSSILTPDPSGGNIQLTRKSPPTRTTPAQTLATPATPATPANPPPDTPQPAHASP